MARAPALEAFRAIVDSARERGEGFRCVTIGASGSGKTYFGKRLIEYALRAGACDAAFVYDHKDPRPAFEGAVRADLADLFARPPLQGETTIVFHADGPGQPDEVAELAMKLAPDQRVLIDIDECFPDAVTEGGMSFRSGQGGPIGLALRTGRSRGTSIILGTQMPQYMPSVATDLAESVVWFRLQGRSLDYVERERRMPREAAAIVGQLEVGQCLLIRDGQWDGKVYGPG